MFSLQTHSMELSKVTIAVQSFEPNNFCNMLQFVPLASAFLKCLSTKSALQTASFASIGKAMQIPLVDLKAQYATIKTEIDQAISQVIADTAFISGKYAKTFEQEFAAWAGFQHCVGCGNGTDALELA